MTYMHLDIFPADRLGWLCRALNTRDAGRHSHFQISGIYLCRTIQIFHVWLCSNMLFQKVTNHNGVGLAGGGREGGEGRSRVLTENAESAQMRGRVSRK